MQFVEILKYVGCDLGVEIKGIQTSAVGSHCCCRFLHQFASWSGLVLFLLFNKEELKTIYTYLNRVLSRYIE